MRVKTLTILAVLTCGLTVAPGLIPGIPTGLELTGTATAASGDMVYVGGAGPGNYSSIQAGVDAVPENGTVYVHNGTYYENVVINKTISLVGEEKTATVVDGNGSEDVIFVSADRVNVSGLTVRNSGGMVLLNAGIDINANNTRISHTICMANYIGIRLGAGASNNHITHCDLYTNSLSGIHFDGAYDVDDTTGNTVTRCNISHNGNDGLYIFGSSYNSFSHCNIYANGAEGVEFEGADNNDLANCTIYNNTQGIELWDRGHNTISNCNISRHAWSGIDMSDSDNNTVVACNISHATEGIKIGQSDNNTFIDCTLFKNYNGTRISPWTDGNTLYHNNFIKNLNQPAVDMGNNTWYSASLEEGNHWSTYDEPSEGAYDNDSDGIIDSSYNISGGDSRDLYPLAGQWQPDVTPPATALSLLPSAPNGNGGWYVTNVRATLSAFDGDTGVAATEYRINDGSWDTYIGPVVLEDGVHTLSYYSVDNAGNEEAVATKTLRIDTVTPQTTLETFVDGVETTLNESTWYDDDVTVTLDTDSDAGSRVAAYYRFVGKTRGFQRYEEPLEVTAEGVHRLEYFSRDRAGNAEALQTLTIRIDKSEPQVTVKTPQASHLYVMGRELIPLDSVDHAAVVIGPVPVEITAVDDVSGIEEVRFTVDGTVKHVDNTTPYTWSWDEALVGPYNIEVAVENGAGDVVDRDIPVVVLNWNT